MQPITDMEITGFQLSRLYSQGWNAAKKWRSEGEGKGRSLPVNPYRDRSAEERDRWQKGYDEGMRSPTGPTTALKGSAWHRSPPT